MRSCDVLVIGGGPAGSMTAAHLIQRGFDVLLVDGARFPRDKVCGEGVSPEAWTALREVGARGAVERLAPHALAGMRLVAPDGAHFSGRYGARRGFAARRSDLDAALLGFARDRGVDIREGTRATRVSFAAAEASTELALPGGDMATAGARVVVLAEGRGGGIARRLGLVRESRSLRKFAMRGHWSGVDALGDLGEMHVGGGGYCGIAPLSSTDANVAFVLDVHEMPAAGGDVETFYRKTLERWPGIASRLERATLLAPPRATGPLAVEAQRLTAHRLLLVGDAAGFYDPFTGEGVTLALKSAAMAADAVEAFLHRGASLRSYELRRHDATAAKFRFNRLLQHVVRRPALACALARRLARRPDVADALVGVAGDFVPASAAFRLNVLWDLLRATA